MNNFVGHAWSYITFFNFFFSVLWGSPFYIFCTLAIMIIAAFAAAAAADRLLIGLG
jgi:hypothetical protein